MTAQDQMAASGAGEPAFPLAATIAGVEVVTIPLADYADLLECRRRLGSLRDPAKRYAVPSRSPIEADAEIGAFFAENLGRIPMDTILRECRKRFGADRTPSRSAAYRHWHSLRHRTEAWK